MTNSSRDNYWMSQALQLAHQAQDNQEVPVGALIVLDDQLIGSGHNQPISCHDPSAHAEIVAIRQAANHQRNYRLPHTTLYVTLEPCAMCVGAMIHARIARLVFAADDPKTGAVHSAFDLLSSSKHNHQIAVSHGQMAEQSRELLQQFFQQRRKTTTN